MVSLDKGLIKNTRDLPFGLKSIIWTAAAVIYRDKNTVLKLSEQARMMGPMLLQLVRHSYIYIFSILLISTTVSKSILAGLFAFD